MTPAFSATLFPVVRRGRAVRGAESARRRRVRRRLARSRHARPEAERVRRLHCGGRVADRQQVHAAAEKLAISGGSNGGLLTGTVVTQRPDLFRAAIVAVPLLDMLRYQDFLMARYWVPEYGSAEDAEQFKYLLAYSPYQHVKAGTKYPAVLLTAGEHDTRVHALHARKMAARAAGGDGVGSVASEPVLLWVDREAGHGQGKPLNLLLRDAVDQRIFVMWQLGMLPEPVGRLACRRPEQRRSPRETAGRPTTAAPTAGAADSRQAARDERADLARHVAATDSRRGSRRPSASERRCRPCAESRAPDRAPAGPGASDVGGAQRMIQVADGVEHPRLVRSVLHVFQAVEERVADRRVARERRHDEREARLAVGVREARRAAACEHAVARLRTSRTARSSARSASSTSDSGRPSICRVVSPDLLEPRDASAGVSRDAAKGREPGGLLAGRRGARSRPAAQHRLERRARRRAIVRPT